MSIYFLTLDTWFIDPLIDFLSKYGENWIFELLLIINHTSVDGYIDIVFLSLAHYII